MSARVALSPNVALWLNMDSPDREERARLREPWCQSIVSAVAGNVGPVSWTRSRPEVVVEQIDRFDLTDGLGPDDRFPIVRAAVLAVAGVDVTGGTQ